MITTGTRTGTGGEMTGETDGGTTGHGGRSAGPAAGAVTGSGTRLRGSGTNPQHPISGSKVNVCSHLTSAFALPSKFNILSIATQIFMQRMDSD